ncbi:hypothetical protein [Nocardia panacis]|uniref:hypothetical protein n=1 Tax=Nocardia panacis TaxID=2340916 RepID=UPI0011C44853|nr:hypothetical protein [Nocardia panacis]
MPESKPRPAVAVPIFDSPSEGLITAVLVGLLNWESPKKQSAVEPIPLEPISALLAPCHGGRTLEEVLYMLRDGLAAVITPEVRS